MPPSVGPVTVEPGEEVKFEAIAQDDWGQDLTADTKWTWDFGDGEQSNQNPVWHVFKSGGSFTVTVTGCCSGQEASDRIICQQFPEGVVWSLHCNIQIIGQPDPDVEPGGDVCHTSEVHVRHEGDLDPWEMMDEFDYWCKVGEGEWGERHTEEEDYIVWDTLENKNEPVHWKAEVHLGIWDDEEEEWGQQIHFWVGPETWNVKNTVVSSENDVLLWDPEDPEGSQVTISWDIVHAEAIDPVFTVDIHICGLSGDMVREFSVPGPVGVGEGSVDWDGLVEDEEENLVTADKGVYAYKVFAEDEEECHDCDKTETYTPYIIKFYHTDIDEENSTMDVFVRYRQPRDCGQCFVRIYGDDLALLAQLEGQTAAGEHLTRQVTIDVELDEEGQLVGTYTAMVFTFETAGQGAADRGPDPKWHKQKGLDWLTKVGGDLDFQDTTEETEEEPGGILIRNDDDDDEDDIRDRFEQEADIVTLVEDDFRWLHLSEESDNLTGVEMSLDITQGANRVRIWEYSQELGRYQLVELPATWNLDEDTLPTELQAEGIERSETPRDVTLALTWRIGQDIEMTDTVNVTVLVIDLDMDADRDGAVTDTEADDWHEEKWDDEKGAVILNNNDDDDEGGQSDNVNQAVDGPNDANDLAELQVHRILDVPLPAGWRIVLRAPGASEDRMRVFDERSEAGTARIGPTAGAQYEIPDIVGDGVMTYGTEGIGYDTTPAAGPLRLELALLNGVGQEIFADEVAVRVAPYTLLSNLANGQTLYVMLLPSEDLGGGGNERLVQALRDAVGANAVEDIPGADYGYDHWVQDEFEIGSARGPWAGASGGTSVVWDLPRDGWLDEYPEAEMLGPGYGHFEFDDGGGSGNYGGNLEVSGPVTIGDRAYPVGIAIIGQNMEGSLRNFIIAQNVQVSREGDTPQCVELNVNWLLVQHVDEVMMIVPGASEQQEFRILIADPGLAMELLGQSVPPERAMFYTDPGAEEDSGAVDSATTDTLTAAGKAYADHQWQGAEIRVFDATPAERPGQVRRVVDNEGNTLRVAPGWNPVPDNTWAYVVVAVVHDAGQVAEATPDTLRAAGANYQTNQWRGSELRIYEGTGAGEVVRVVSNTADTFTVAPNWGIVPDDTSRFVVCHRRKQWGNGDPALITVGEVLADDQLIADNSTWQTELYPADPDPTPGDEPVYASLRTGLGLEPADFIHVPVLFWYQVREWGQGAAAYVPNMVNCQLFNGRLLVARPFGPRNAAGQDVFEQELKQYFEQGTVRFIDDWEWYHIRDGESHCGTNARRTPSDVNWWEHWE